MTKTDKSTGAGAASFNEVLDYWNSIGKDGWFNRDDEIDRIIRERFLTTHELAASGALDSWQERPDSCLALILVLDQFSRNMFRNDPRAFATDANALSIAENAVENGFHLEVEGDLAQFFFMPFMHSESMDAQNRCVELMHCFCARENFDYAIIHRDVIARFGRFPHRNPALKRNTTHAEQAFLDAGGFSA
ncbi:MAG: DUF924 family protein [Rhizobiaceae bacterium]